MEETWSTFEDNKKLNGKSWENKQQKCEESKQRIGDLNRKTTKIVESNHRNWDRSTNEVCFQLHDLFKKTVDNLEDRTAAFAEY